VSYINSSEHKRFISLCNSLITEKLENENHLPKDDERQLLKNDLDKLQQVAEKYRITFSQLPKLSEEYKVLQRNIRINIRRLKLTKKSIIKKAGNE